MPAGGTPVGAPVDATARKWCSAFRDQGRGIGQRGAAARSSSRSSSGSPMGTGIGLAIVYRIVREHSGDITVSSSPPAARSSRYGCRWWRSRLPPDASAAPRGPQQHADQHQADRGGADPPTDRRRRSRSSPPGAVPAARAPPGTARWRARSARARRRPSRANPGRRLRSRRARRGRSSPFRCAGRWRGANGRPPSPETSGSREVGSLSCQHDLSPGIEVDGGDPPGHLLVRGGARGGTDHVARGERIGHASESQRIGEHRLGPGGFREEGKAPDHTQPTFPICSSRTPRGVVWVWETSWDMKDCAGEARPVKSAS